MSEKQLQHRIVMWFSQEYPQHRGHLFLINNDNISEKDIFKRIANRNKQFNLLELINKLNFANKKSQLGIGLIPGVSDLILIHPDHKTIHGIEIKAPGSTHKTSHLQRQIEWGTNVCRSYIMSPRETEIKDFIISLLFRYDIKTIIPKLTSSKTFKF